MARYLKIIIIIIFICFLSVNCFASEVDDYTKQFLTGAPDEFSYEENTINSISFDKITAELAKLVSKSLTGCTNLFATLMCAVLLFSFVSEVVQKENSALITLLNITASVTFIAICLKILKSNLSGIKDAIESMQIFTASAIPVVTGLCISSGDNFSAVIFSSAMTLITTVMEYVGQTILLPLSVVYMGIGMTGCITDDYNILSVSSFIKKLIKWIIGAFLGVFTFAFSIQNIVAKSSDSLAKKSIKLAVGNLIPIVGSSLSAGIENVFALAASTRTTLAVIGVLVILFIFLPYIVGNICYGLTISAARTIAGFMQLGRVKKILNVLSDTFFIIAGVCSACVYTVILSFLLICLNMN